MKQYRGRLSPGNQIMRNDSLTGVVLNRLLGFRCYIAGAIDKCKNSGKVWRQQITPLLNQMGVIVLNPLDKPFSVGLETDDNRFRRDNLKKAGEYNKFSRIMRKIRHIDLRMVDMADFIIVYLDLEIFACGTMEELFWANRQKKPIIVLCPQGKADVPDWLFGTLPHQVFFTSVDEVMKYLDDIDKGLNKQTFGRWLFPEFNKLYHNIEKIGG